MGARNVLCLRYLLVGSFVLLGISGVVVCGAGSYFLHQLRDSLNSPLSYGPPAILLTTGIINVILGPYFCHFLDTKYNQPQLCMFLIFVVLVAIIQAGAVIWSLVSLFAVDFSISEILEDDLAAVGTVDNRPPWNISEIKVNCCGFEKSPSNEFDEDDPKISWSCCNARSIQNTDRPGIDTCHVFYTIECRQLALHRYRSTFFHIFVLGLVAFCFQAWMYICMRTYARAVKRSLRTKRARSIVAQSFIAQPMPQLGMPKTCAGASLGPQHVCEGCSPHRYQ